MPTPIIPDTDFDRWLAFHDAMPKGLIPRDWERAPYGSFAAPFEAATPFKLFASREELADMIRTKDRERSWPGDMADDAGVPLLDQSQTNYCWSFGTVGAAMDIRAIEGKPLVVLSPSSVAGPASGYRNVGGQIGDAIQQAMIGIAPAGNPPNGYRMATSHNDWTPETKAAALSYAITGWVDLYHQGTPQWDRVNRIASAMCNSNQPTPVVFALNRMSHVMRYRKVTIIKTSPLTFGFEDQNSWQPNAGGFDEHSRIVMSENVGTGDEAYAVWQGM